MGQDFSDFISNVWQHKPAIVVLFVIGLIVLVVVIVDTHRHRKQRKERHRIKRFH